MPAILVRPIWSKRAKIHWPSVKKELEKWLDTEVKKDLEAYGDRIVADWKDKPKFKTRKVVKPNRFMVYMWPIGEYADRWKWISRGTGLYGPKHKKYPIRPKVRRRGPGGRFRKAAAALRFREDYDPRTRPGCKYKGPGSASGDYVFRKLVMHPGIKPRNFEKCIASWYKKTKRYPRGAKNAIERGIYRGRRA